MPMFSVSEKETKSLSPCIINMIRIPMLGVSVEERDEQKIINLNSNLLYNIFLKTKKNNSQKKGY